MELHGINCEQTKNPIHSDHSGCLFTEQIYSAYGTIGDNIVKTCLPELLFQRHGKCVVNYMNETNKIPFENNPFVTEFVKIDFYPYKLCMVPWNDQTANVLQGWCEVYGFQVLPETKPRIYGYPRQTPKRRRIVIHNKKGREWGLKDGESLKLLEILSKKYDIYSLRDTIGVLHSSPYVVQTHFENLKDLFSLLASADLFIGSDSGPMHAATALGIPCVILSPNYHRGHAQFDTRRKTQGASEYWVYPFNLQIMTQKAGVNCSCPFPVYKSAEEVLEAVAKLMPKKWIK